MIEASGVPVLPLPDYDLGRPEKLKIALVSGIARGLYKEGDVVVGLLARKPVAYARLDPGGDRRPRGRGRLVRLPAGRRGLAPA